MLVMFIYLGLDLDFIYFRNNNKCEMNLIKKRVYTLKQSIFVYSFIIDAFRNFNANFTTYHTN